MVVGGVAFSVAGPLLLATGNPQLSNLFSTQALLDVWIIGTTVRLVVATRRVGA